MRSCMRSCKSVAYVLIMRHAQLSVHVLARPQHARLELIKVGLQSREMKRTYHAAFFMERGARSTCSRRFCLP